MTVRAMPSRPNSISRVWSRVRRSSSSTRKWTASASSTIWKSCSDLKLWLLISGSPQSRSDPADALLVAIDLQNTVLRNVHLAGLIFTNIADQPEATADDAAMADADGRHL